ncbi:succinylglutamate desuccinylase/aspartoacylase family protein [Phototrophicus methaneseepsis]|uniref:Succinylglutamate desuccinylase/aspartoacylase family protein n=1 Tax=Phototrophicus methaneseepsis TaxID=2710758 RepID=A0A7S8EAD1_9CHLR|nr:M14 family metallopeptidase [Phototrophicus methaneseepsis]QPC83276.1 succinylglutamate desuccinylase/aspartoacylase family protein [Phototrophicus methaneseepsis]
MTSLLDSMLWTEHALPASSAHGSVPVKIGEVGSGGPVALITAGIHGDEGPWGAWAIRQLLQSVETSALQGTLRVIPAANPLAMTADLRNAPLDQLDLNRTFPGNEKGSYTERVAHLLAQTALEGVDTVIDLHGGGSWCVNSFVFRMQGGEMLSDCFDAPFSMKAPDRAVSLTGYTRTLGKAVVGVEMGGKSGYERHWAERITKGLHRALAKVGVLSEAGTPAREYETIPVGGSTVLRPTNGGVFVPAVGPDQIGTIVPGGTILGHVYDPGCVELLETLTAPFDQTAILLLRPFITQIEGGAMTYVVAEPQA